MSAVMHWRCDICGTEAEKTEEMPSGFLTFFHPTIPDGWFQRDFGKVRRQLCSQRCVVAHYEALLYREQKKLADKPSA